MTRHLGRASDSGLLSHAVTVPGDRYLEVLLRKPGALPGATALEQARASGRFTSVHERLVGRGLQGPR